MAGEPQSEDMNATQIAERQVIERYLANQLSDAEADAFEAYVEAHPELTRQIELVARMKSGLAVLRRRGELQGILNTPARSGIRRLAFLAAAAASIAVVALLVFRFSSESHGPLLAATFDELRGSRQESLQLASTHLLVRSRGPAYGTEVELPADSTESTALHLTLSTGEAAGTGQYAVEIVKLDDGVLQSVAKLDNAAMTADGDVHVYVRADVLRPGSYVVRLKAPGSTTALEFAMRVTSSKAR